MSRPGTDGEAGRGLRPDRADRVPEELRHRPETVEVPDSPDHDRCPHCGHEARLAGINPFARCPARSLPSMIEVRADAADDDDQQATLPHARARADGGKDS